MSVPSEPELDDEAYAAEHQGPIPKTVLRRERRIAGGLLAAIVLLGLAGYATIPTEAELVETATTHPDPEARIKAMNAMIRRGYWEDRSFAEFEAFLKASPREVPQFNADMHGDLLKPDRRAWKR